MSFVLYCDYCGAELQIADVLYENEKDTFIAKVYRCEGCVTAGGAATEENRERPRIGTESALRQIVDNLGVALRSNNFEDLRNQATIAVEYGEAALAATNELHTPTIRPSGNKCQLNEPAQADFIVAVYYCPICRGPMVVDPKCDVYWRDTSTFPGYCEMRFEPQARRANLGFVSDVCVDDKAICVACAEAGKADFLCAMCKNRHSTDQVQESFGDPPEHLCKECYGSVPAREWEEKVGELREQHRYDFE